MNETELEQETQPAEEKPKTYTQEEVNRMISERLGREEKKWTKRIESERTEAEKLARMKAEERAEYEANKKSEALAQREKEITMRELKAQAFETLAEKGLPRELVNTLNLTDADACNESINNIEKIFKAAVEASVNEKLRGKSQPSGGSSTFSKKYTREELANMSVEEINKHWDEIKDLL